MDTLLVNKKPIRVVNLRFTLFLTNIDTLDFESSTRLQIDDYVEISGVFLGFVKNIVYTQENQNYSYKCESKISLLNRITFTEDYVLKSGNITTNFSVNGVKVENYNLKSEDLEINLNVSGQTYFGALRRITEIKNFAFWYDYSKDTIFLGNPTNPVNQRFEISQIEEITTNLANRIYPFSDEYKIFNKDDILNLLKTVKEYPVKENERGLYIEDENSILKLRNDFFNGVYEEYAIINDIPINNALNEDRINIVNSTYLSAINRLKFLANPEIICTVNQINIEKFTDINVGENIIISDELFFVSQLDYDLSGDNILVNPTLSNKSKDEFGVLTLLRRLDRESKKRKLFKKLEVKNFSFTLEPNEKQETFLDLDYGTITQAEAYYTVKSDFDVYSLPLILIEDVEVFGGYTDIEGQNPRSIRIPKTINADIRDIILSDEINKKEKVKITCVNKDEYISITVDISFLIEVVT
jgi:hypothetical protein